MIDGLQAQVNEACEMRELATTKFLRELDAKAHYFHAHATASNPQLGKKAIEENMMGAMELCFISLKRSQTFAWTDTTTQAVLRASTKLPRDVPFHRAWLPVKCGFWWLGRNSHLIVPCETGRTVGLIDPNNIPPPYRRICAITFNVLEDSIFLEGLSLDHNESFGPTGIIAAMWKEGEDVRTFMRRNREIKNDDNIWWNQACDILGTFLMTGCLWLQQKVPTVSSPYEGYRQVRKRLAKLDISTEVRIVHLRAAESKPVQNPGSGQPLRWRIHVGAEKGGFWRNQPYPAKGYTIPIWIKDYWKGPEDAPEKAPSKVIYAVTR